MGDIFGLVYLAKKLDESLTVIDFQFSHGRDSVADAVLGDALELVLLPFLPDGLDPQEGPAGELVDLVPATKQGVLE